MRRQKIRVYDSSFDRVDIWLRNNFPELSRSLLSRLIKEGRLKINHQVIKKPSRKVQPGDLLEISWPEISLAHPQPQFLPLDIIYEDRDLLVLSKKKGISVHPVSPFEKNTLVNALVYYGFSLASYGRPLRPGIVHRLDRDTSGVMVVAKSDYAYLHLVKEFKARRVEKTYVAIVEGWWEGVSTIDLPLARSRKNPLRMEVHYTHGKSSCTEVSVLHRKKEFSLLFVKPKTGRTHQIRAHLSAMGHPIAGDQTYGSKEGRKYFTSQALHAFALSFVHPTSSVRMSFAASLPSDMQEFIGSFFGEDRLEI